MWKVSLSACGTPNSLTNGVAKSAHRVSVQTVAPSPARITGFPASIRRPTASPSLKIVGSIERTVWLGRTMVQGNPLERLSMPSQAILFWLYVQKGLTVGVSSVIT
jgi:hypothetical protein